jgi:O-glycosyl hydrolase
MMAAFRRVAIGSIFAGAVLLASGAAALAGTPARAATCNIDLTQTRQRIDRFGASTAWYIGLARNAPAPDRQKILDTLLSPVSGIGLTIVRNRIPPKSNRPKASLTGRATATRSGSCNRREHTE